MGPTPGDADAGAPVSIEVALRRVRLFAGALILARFLTSSSLPNIVAFLLCGAFVSVNVVSMIAQRQPARTRVLLGVVQLLADTIVLLLVVYVQTAHTGADTADWAVLVLPAIEGAIRFRVPGAVLSWGMVAAGYSAWYSTTTSSGIEMSTLFERLTIVFLVALPIGFLADDLVDEINAHRRAFGEAEHRTALLRAAALGGQRSTSLDVDEILGVLREIVGGMGFAEVEIFELHGSQLPDLHARPLHQSRDVLAIPPGDHRLLAAFEARRTGHATVWPPLGADEVQSAPGRRSRRRRSSAAPARYSRTFAMPITTTGDVQVVLTARWPGPGAPSDSETESLELLAAQAGASLRNALQHRELNTLKNRLEHEASHDPLTELPNRRRFIEQLERMCGRGRHGDLIAVLFLDLDGFKTVNDRFGHECGNDLLVDVASRLRGCVRPGDVVARMGGDEFTVMLTRLESVAPTVEVAERITSMLHDAFRIAGLEVHISASIGIAVAPADAANPGDLLRRADVAMYRAKSQGKAGWAMDPSSLDPAAREISEA
jgi:diguanylate cyclase (GGDEF)-like protein